MVTFEAGSATEAAHVHRWVEDANSPVDVSAISALPTSSDPFRVGTTADTASGKWLDGRVDDLRLYSRVLTPTEVVALGQAAPSNVGPLVDAGGPYGGAPQSPVGVIGTASDGEGDPDRRTGRR